MSVENPVEVEEVSLEKQKQLFKDEVEKMLGDFIDPKDLHNIDMVSAKVKDLKAKDIEELTKDLVELSNEIKGGNFSDEEIVDKKIAFLDKIDWQNSENRFDK